MDWNDFRVHRPRLMWLLILLKRFRTKIGLVLVVYCLAEGWMDDESPFDLVRPNLWVVAGILLIAAGLAFRLAAHGCIKKKETLATSGVYSLCRHPLYLGSML